MKFKKKLFLMIGLTFFFLMGYSVSANEINFSQELVLPENQVEGVTNYFDLKVQPSQNQILKTKLTNLSEKDITILVDVNSATTSDAGEIQYSSSDKKKDSSLIYDFKDMAKYEKKVVVPAKQTIIYPIQITIPEDSFDGILLGGVQFREEDPKEKKVKKSNENIQIKNNYAYEVAIRLKETPTDIPAEFNLTGIKAGQINYRNAVKANLQAPQPKALTDLKITGKVYHEKGKKILHKQTVSNMTVSPNSNFDFGIPWGTEEFKAGTYRLEMNAIAKEGEWFWTKTFTITSGEAKKLNNVAIEVEINYAIYYVIGGVVFVLLLLVVVYFIGSHKPPIKHSSKKKARTRKK